VAGANALSDRNSMKLKTVHIATLGKCSPNQMQNDASVFIALV
jgi:hypothetical protein